ncbi:CHAT domain-containing protein [Nucisporomicrobium flavum]|uniref:CHAT domain-containing protein n=1 Tax=Nucisporomicrobium flavum TaxID=2785915 RepID=UPI003C2DB8B9
MDASAEGYDGDAIEDYDAAIAWGTRLRADPETRELGVVRLADLFWDRSWVIRYGDDDVDAAEDLNRLIGLLAELEDERNGPVVSRYLRMLHGMALAERAELGDGDVDAVIAQLEPALEELIRLPDGEYRTEIGDNRLALAAHSLAEAYRRRGELDRAVAVLERALADHATGLLRTFVSSSLAATRQERWHDRMAAGDDVAAAAELKAGIAVCEADGADDPWLLALHGELLTARAEQDRSDVDAEQAAGLLDRAAELMADAPDGWRFWRSAATAHRLRPQEPGELETAAHRIERALTYVLPDDDRLTMHADLVAIAHERTTPDLRNALEAGIRAWDTATDADPGLRAAVALLLAYGYFAAVAADLGDVDAAGIRRLLDAAADRPGADDEWRALVDYGTGVLEHYEDMLDPRRPGDGGLRRLARAAAFQQPDADFAQRLRLTLALAGQADASRTGDRRTAEAARQQADPGRPLPERPAPAAQEPVSAADVHVVEVYSRLMEQMQANDMIAVVATAREALPVLEASDPAGPEVAFRDMVRALAALGDLHGSAPLDIPAVDRSGGMGAVVQYAGAMMTATAALGQAMYRNDLPRMREIATTVEQLIASVPNDDGQVRLGAAALAGQAHLEIAVRAPEATYHARRAADWFGQALDHAGGVGHQMWSRLAMGRADALRRTGGDHAAGRAHGMSALQGHAWQVFAQAGTDHSIASAKQAAADARKVAGWCLADRRRDPAALDQLIAALDAGRGLVLRATTTARAIAEQLIRAGHAELAAEWTETAGQGHDMVTGLGMAAGSGSQGTEVPDDLRLRVLRALGGEQVLGYESITAREIRAALRATGTQALVYLLSAENGREGAAVVVPAGGPPIVITLPRLETGPDSPVRWYVRTQPHTTPARTVPTGPDRGPEDRDLGPVADVTDPGRGLDELCAWAGDAAMSTVLRVVPGGPDRRLVLVPMGMLALVPWHAAFDGTQSPRRYAAEQAVISYSPSARAFCTAATRPRTPIASALIVGDPTGDLPHAGAEAQAIRDRFYPAGATAHTPDEVLHWVTTHPAGGAVLHFACHGAVDPRLPADAHLVLGGHAGLTVRTLLETSQSAELDVQEVFLAACTTGVTGNDHDEVLSLATSFLAAGAHTVIGSLWPVPDDATSLLMFKVHEHLRVTGCPPADALHRAQLWMLDRDRDVTGIPPDLLGDYRPGMRFPLTSWAGFTHIGR